MTFLETLKFRHLPALARARALFLELECALFERVNVAHHQDRNKTEHAPEDESALLDRVSVNHRPGIHEDNFEIEEDKEHRHQIKLHAEPRMSFTLRHHTALVSGIFGPGAFSACPHQNADQQRGAGKEYRYYDLHENWQIFAQHPGSPR